MPMKKGPDGMPYEVPTDLVRGGAAQDRSRAAEPDAAAAPPPRARPGWNNPNEAPTVPSWRARGDESRTRTPTEDAGQTLAKSAPTGYQPPPQGSPTPPHAAPSAGSAPTRIYRPERDAQRAPVGGAADGGGSAAGERPTKPSAGTDDGMLPVGWLVVTDGPGRGKLAPLYFGWNRIGRSPDARNQVVLNFGDDGISGEDHAAIVFDEAAQTFHLAHRQGLNGTYVNGALVLSATAIDHGHAIRISKTTLRFVRLCGPDFSW